MFDRNHDIGGAKRHALHRLRIPGIGIFVAGLALALAAGFAAAASPGSASPDTSQGTGSTAVRKTAVQSIPMDKLDAEARKKVNAVLSNVGIYRRLPVRMVKCDPDMYLFLIRHPDVVVNIWEVLGVAQIQMRQIDIDTFRIVESEGCVATLEYIYHSRDMQIIYGSWTYTGPLLVRNITGNCLAILKSSYAKDTDGKYFITSSMDGFLSTDSGGAELLARTLQPLVVKNIDNNFIQTVSFLGSMSKTAEVNSGGMLRLAGRLTHVQPETRQQLTEVVTSVAHRSATNTASNAAARKADPPQRVASQSEDGSPPR